MSPRAVARDTLAAIAADLTALLAGFIRHGLRVKSAQMLAGIAALAPEHLSTNPRSHLSQHLTVPLRAPSAPAGPQSYPRHALTIASAGKDVGDPHAIFPSLRCSRASPPSRPRTSPASLPRSHLLQHLTVSLRVPSAPADGPPSYPTHALPIAPAGKDVGSPYAIFPVHAVVLAAYCATLPRCSRSAPAHSHSSVSLPVLPLPLPSPQAFAIRHGFMYTHRPAPALPTLLLLPPAFLVFLERPSNAQDAAHTAILSTLVSSTARHTLAACMAPLRAT
ncbi:hypothetical protein C8R44DRAFT_895783 [Mycena epipterygia]|nr:hypothetical protein C8R44DRAFT_895783 [Mycena epipterygia]